jgi:hypothetical protein
MKIVVEAKQHFGSSFSWTLKRLGNLLFGGLYLFHDTCSTKVCLSFDRGLTLSPIDSLFGCTRLLYCQWFFLFFSDRGGPNFFS